MGLLSEDATLRKLGEETLERCLQVLRSSPWKLEKESSSGDKIYSANLPDFGKIFLIEAVLNIPPQVLLKVLYDGIEDLHKWNKQFISSQRLKTIDPNTDITYAVTASAMSGLVSSRDFVCVRHHQKIDEAYFSAACSIQHPLAPRHRSYIRGDTKLSLYAMQPIPGRPNWCTFQWFNCVRLGGWLPHYVVEAFFTSGLTDYVNNIRQYTHQLKEEGHF